MNSYSYSYGKLKRLYHPFEILIQKIWYLLYNKKTVNIKNINNLDIGYSCILDKFSNNDYTELFKYMIKDFDESKNILTYNNFITLYYGLYRVKQIQGYGVFYNVKDELDVESVEDVYNSFMDYLRSQENPSRMYSSPKDLLNNSNSVLISRKSYFKYYIKALRDS